MKKNQQYVVKDQAAADKLARQWVFTNLARLPTGVHACKQEWQGVQSKLGKRSELPMSEVGTYALFAGELFAWFCVGEIIGRGGSISGYNV
ncbi:hypothetical protein WJX72_008720 [[Myrmecia] bisecta]|uniref:ATP synthase subunit g, mitochondrial n=1 Tax=[Myrmecia] bisecta TaxID=41462 RepID=A0AAW1R8R5_9CHLO